MAMQASGQPGSLARGQLPRLHAKASLWGTEAQNRGTGGGMNLLSIWNRAPPALRDVGGWQSQGPRDLLVPTLWEGTGRSNPGQEQKL